MPRNGSGTYTAPSNSFNPASNNTPIDPTDWNTQLTDYVAAFTDSLSRTGSGGMQADLDMGTHSITNASAISATSLVVSSTVNKVTITTPSTAATLTIANNGSLITSGAFPLTLTVAATANATIPSGTHTLVATDVTATLTNKTFNSSGTGNTLQVSGVTVSAGQYPGTATNDNATAGNVGESQLQTVLAASAVSLSSGVTSPIATITLTAGDWEIWANAAYTGNVSTTVTAVRSTIATASATENTASPFFVACAYGGATAFGTFDMGLAIPPIRVSLSGSQQYWLTGRASFGTSTCSGYGTIHARRMR